jgi:vacuolar-type H+-ATPase subunit E/Vma4
VTTPGSIEAVVLAVQEDARAEIDKIERDLATAIARLREEYATLPGDLPDAGARIAAARRQARDRIAAEDWTDHQAALSHRETWIHQVVAEGERKLRALDPAVLRADLVELVREALDRMPNEPLELLVPAGQIDVAEMIARDGTLAASGRVVTRVGVASEVTSGCILQTAGGRIRYENSYSSRARRLEAEWRARLGNLYAQGRPESVSKDAAP